MRRYQVVFYRGLSPNDKVLDIIVVRAHTQYEAYLRARKQVHVSYAVWSATAY